MPKKKLPDQDRYVTVIVDWVRSSKYSAWQQEVMAELQNRLGPDIWGKAATKVRDTIIKEGIEKAVEDTALEGSGIGKGVLKLSKAIQWGVRTLTYSAHNSLTNLKGRNPFTPEHTWQYVDFIMYSWEENGQPSYIPE
jgi:hypothetical protein